MHSERIPIAGRRLAGIAVRAATVAGCALIVCACNTDQQVAGGPDTPADYRQRHPITLHEADHTLELMIGSNRGELNPTQRAQVLSFGLASKREATGGIVVRRPEGSSNERAAADAMREIISILAASGMQPQSIAVTTYPAAGPGVASVRITYPKITAQAGPCGVWPRDIGPAMTRDYFDNQPYWNYGCATQRNLAAQVADPADLVQPRGETPAYAMRRTTVIERYREGQSPATQDTGSAATAKITDVAK